MHFRRRDKNVMLVCIKLSYAFLNHVRLCYYILSQPGLPISSEVDLKVGGTRCDLLMSRLQPWLHLHGKTHGGTHTLEKSKPADIETIMWRGTVSTPEMTVILYGLDDLPMYHVSNLIQHLQF